MQARANGARNVRRSPQESPPLFLGGQSCTQDLDDAREHGHAPRDLRLAEETENADLGQAAVVELAHEALGLGLGRLLLGEAEGVEEVEGHGVHELAKVLPGRRGGTVTLNFYYQFSFQTRARLVPERT